MLNGVRPICRPGGSVCRPVLDNREGQGGGGAGWKVFDPRTSTESSAKPVCNCSAGRDLGKGPFRFTEDRHACTIPRNSNATCPTVRLPRRRPGGPGRHAPHRLAVYRERRPSSAPLVAQDPGTANPRRSRPMRPRTTRWRSPSPRRSTGVDEAVVRGGGGEYPRPQAPPPTLRVGPRGGGPRQSTGVAVSLNRFNM